MNPPAPAPGLPGCRAAPPPGSRFIPGSMIGCAWWPPGTPTSKSPADSASARQPPRHRVPPSHQAARGPDAATSRPAQQRPCRHRRPPQHGTGQGHLRPHPPLLTAPPGSTHHRRPAMPPRRPAIRMTRELGSHVARWTGGAQMTLFGAVRTASRQPTRTHNQAVGCVLPDPSPSLSVMSPFGVPRTASGLEAEAGEVPCRCNGTAVAARSRLTGRTATPCMGPPAIPRGAARAARPDLWSGPAAGRRGAGHGRAELGSRGDAQFAVDAGEGGLHHFGLRNRAWTTCVVWRVKCFRAGRYLLVR
jgi:hypothetical protein